MKRIILATCGLAALAAAAPAYAADLPARMPTKAPVVMESIYNWTGLYIGAHVGYGWADKDWNQTFSSFGLAPDRTTSPNKPNSFLGGGQIGFNWQTGQMVFGIEGDASWTDASDCGRPHAVFISYHGCDQVNWYATATARLGLASGPALFYVKGGAAFAGEEHNITFTTPAGVTSVVTDTPDDTRFGWTVGGGVEYAFAPNWSAKIEYNFMDFGKQSYSFTYAASPAGLVERWDINQQVHVAKFGINYRFGGAPVSARY
jgi:outer membrane immunogenic protein